MKRGIFLGSILLLMGFVHNPKYITDYRDAYVGNYVCSRTHRYLNDAGTALVNDVTTYTIGIQKDSGDSLMSIALNEGTFVLKFVPPDLGTDSNNIRVSGNFFASDSIFIKFRLGKGPDGSFYIGKKN